MLFLRRPIHLTLREMTGHDLATVARRKCKIQRMRIWLLPRKNRGSRNSPIRRAPGAGVCANILPTPHAIELTQHRQSNQGAKAVFAGVSRPPQLPLEPSSQVSNVTAAASLAGTPDASAFRVDWQRVGAAGSSK
jgi:hypothetical protein